MLKKKIIVQTYGFCVEHFLRPSHVYQSRSGCEIHLGNYLSQHMIFGQCALPPRYIRAVLIDILPEIWLLPSWGGQSAQKKKDTHL